ncbi:MAG: nucleotidyltransferase family protein [Deltaproteobacteria bacterium]|nr:nucleotidyltransferase family protein [Deltaproteobacteria bacterium]
MSAADRAPVIEACVLAAGRGSRMGAAKHLLALEGVPLLERVVRALSRTSVARISVVLAPGDVDGRALAARLGAIPLEAESADEGRAASVRAGVRAVRADSAGLLFALADQPFLAPEDFERLLAEFRANPSSIVRAQYGEAAGSPVVFARGYFAELLELRGREGGRSVIARHPDAVRAVDLPPAHGRDLDRPEDWPRQ